MGEIAALVPMRHHSQRVPEKNFRDLAGKPLYAYILNTLEQVPEIGEIVVDTDSPAIKEGIAAAFPAVRVLNRPAELQADEIPMNQILLHDTSLVKAEYYLQTHSTNPLLKSETISRGIQTFLSQRERYDSLFSVTRLQTRLWDQQGKAVNHNPSELLQTQDLPPIYEENSCLYLFTRRSLEEHQNRIGSSPLMFEIDPAEAWDIDTPLDFEIVEFLISRRKA
jgi:CMP-N-acetylneuraminic acid synthetase